VVFVSLVSATWMIATATVLGVVTIIAIAIAIAIVVVVVVAAAVHGVLASGGDTGRPGDHIMLDSLCVHRQSLVMFLACMASRRLVPVTLYSVECRVSRVVLQVVL
jgi:hypothetical protein